MSWKLNGRQKILKILKILKTFKNFHDVLEMG